MSEGIKGIAIGAANAVGALVTNWDDHRGPNDIQFELTTTDNVDVVDILTNIDSRVSGQRISVERFPGQDVTSVVIENPVITTNKFGNAVNPEDNCLMEGHNQITEINVHELGAVRPLQTTVIHAREMFGWAAWIDSEE